MKLVFKSELNKDSIEEMNEHKSTIKKIRSSIVDGKLILSDYEIGDMIRRNHTDKDSDYYKKLNKYVEGD